MAATTTPSIVPSVAPSISTHSLEGVGPLDRKQTLRELHLAREAGRSMPMLTCYDYTSARLMQSLGIPLLLVGDSAAMTILGHPSTVHAEQRFLDELAKGVRRGAPLAYLVVDMAFGSYHASADDAVRTVARTIRRTGCDAVKLEVTRSHLPTVERLSEMGVAVWAHLGLRPQAAMISGYRAQGRTADEAVEIVRAAEAFEGAGAAAILLEAVPAEVGQAVVDAVKAPVIGCGAGPGPMAHVVVIQDLLAQTDVHPRFVPDMGQGLSLREAIRRWAVAVRSGDYPAPRHCYEMPPTEVGRLKQLLRGRVSLPAAPQPGTHG